jgi:hypothetical protein
MRALLSTLVAKRRERTVEFELPKIESVADVLKTSSAVISACAAGELSPREASEIMELISSRVRDVYLDGIVLKRSWGRGNTQCLAAGGDQRERRGLSGDSRHL